jgi:hypothetical protein
MVAVQWHSCSPFFTSILDLQKPPLKIIFKTCKVTDVLITKVLTAACPPHSKSLQNDLAVSSTKEAAKVARRTKGNGLVEASAFSHLTGSSPCAVRCPRRVQLPDKCPTRMNFEVCGAQSIES